MLDAYPDSANPVSSWIESNTEYVERVLLMLTDMRDQPQMDYATVSVAVRSLDHLLQATE
jgi:NAD-specific glutamate dehydrogenase